MRRLVVSAAAALALAGCVEQGGVSGGGSSEETPVSAEAAAELFIAACVDQAPRFTESEAVMVRAGLEPAPTGTLYHPSGTLSAKVQNRPDEDGGRAIRCSVVYEGTNSAAVSTLMRARLVPSGEGAAPAQITVGGRPAEAWRVETAAGTGAFYHLPNQNDGKLGALFAQFPQ